MAKKSIDMTPTQQLPQSEIFHRLAIVERVISKSAVEISRLETQAERMKDLERQVHILTGSLAYAEKAISEHAKSISELKMARVQTNDRIVELNTRMDKASGKESKPIHVVPDKIAKTLYSLETTLLQVVEELRHMRELRS